MGCCRVGDPEFRAQLYRRLSIEAFSLLRTADQVLFNDLIENAGLLPPGSLSMDGAPREQFAAYGPCSFEEPGPDLVSLGLANLP